MDQSFELPVHYEGQHLQFEGQLHVFGYTQQIEIIINEISVLYERDEERKWRAIADPDALKKNKSITPALLQAVAQSIEKILG